MPAGRPTDYSPEMAHRICSAIADGYTLRQLCARDDMPSKSTVLLWCQKHPEFADQYARAREELLDVWADEILDIADDGSNDWTSKSNSDGSVSEVLDHDHIQRSRLRVDTRKWLLSKLAPKKYGEKLTTELTGKDGAPLVPVLNVTIGGDKS